MNKLIAICILSILLNQISRDNAYAKENKSVIRPMTTSNIAFGDTLIGFYSNLEESEETGDCGGYTVSFVRDSNKIITGSFVSHEGSCNIIGSKIDSINYNKLNDSISFSFSYRDFPNLPTFKFVGNINRSYLMGKLTLEYSDSKHNTSEEINLLKKDRSFVKRYSSKEDVKDR
jgi:hypothetical protein